MVMITDPQEIKAELKKNWVYTGRISVQKDGVVNCTGDVRYLTNNYMGREGQLPFAWGKVDGDFAISGCNMTTLLGCPSQVGREFTVTFNQITTLEHGPRIVGGIYKIYNNPLTSLNGMPHQCKQFMFSYKEDLPLLQTLTAPMISPFCSMAHRHMCEKLRIILNKYAGTNNPADVLKCASELNEAGFEGNAEW